VGCGWPNIIKQGLMDNDDYWANIAIAVSRFNHAASAMEYLHENDLIELLGNILFAQSSRKCPVIISCNRKSEVSGVENVNHIPDGYEPLKEKYGYMFLTLDMIMEQLLSIVQGEAETVGGRGVDYDYVKGLGRCYKAFTEKIGEGKSKKLGKEILKHFETTLHPTLKDPENFAKKLIKHIMWVFLHETKPNDAFQCLVYFPSRIKPDMPSGGCLIAFNTMPSPKILFLVDNYVSDYFLARSLLNSEFETDYPCTLTNKGFERAVLTSVQRIIREEKKEANFTLAFLDMDGLKKINDTTKSHILGTVAIRAFAESVASHITQDFRSAFGDDAKIFFGRWGGDEFLVGVLSSGPHGRTVIDKKSKALQTEQKLKELCDKIKESTGWDKYIPEAIVHFIGQQRISGTADDALATLMPVLVKGRLHFTAGIGSCSFSSTSDHFFQRYERLRNDVDKVCYIAKHFRRGSVLKLTDEIEKDMDAKEIPICLNNDKFISSLRELYSDAPSLGYVVLIKLEGLQLSRLVECISDSFATSYGRMARVFGTLEASAAIMEAIAFLNDSTKSSTRPCPVIMVAIDNPGDDKAKPSIDQMYTLRSQWAQTLNMKSVGATDPGHEAANQVGILAIKASEFQKFSDKIHIKDDALIIHDQRKPFVFWLQKTVTRA